MINDYNIEWVLQSLVYLLVIIFIGTACVDISENLNVIREVTPSNSIINQLVPETTYDNGDNGCCEGQGEDQVCL